MWMRRRRKRHNDGTNIYWNRCRQSIWDLTRKKARVDEMQHELLLPKAREWEYGTPKAVIEPLIDFW